MKLKDFLSLVEIQTKIASMFPFLFGTLYGVYRFKNFDLLNFILMFLSLLLIDMCTTAINNYMDYNKSSDEVYKAEHNIIGIAGLKEGLVVSTILLLMSGAIFSGLALSLRAGWVVLLLGGLSFFIGIFYTFGPIPISRMPLGEILSGGMMGFVIPFLAVYIHNTELAAISIQDGFLSINIAYWEIVLLILLSLPFVLSISNLMLANNICDLEQDVKNDRFLLPYYIGVRSSLLIFRWSYYCAFIMIPLSVLLKGLPWMSLMGVVSFPFVYRQIKIFLGRQIKSETFESAMKNLVLVSLSNIIPLLLYLVFQKIG